MKLHIKDKDYELSTSLRVVYALRDISHAKNLQEAINSISGLDLDGQLELLYAAYKAGEGKGDNAVSKQEFINDVLDTFGIFAITNAINELADGLLYSGLTPEEIASKKMAVEAAAATAAAAKAGAPSSAEDTSLA